MPGARVFSVAIVKCKKQTSLLEDIKIMLTPTWADNGQIFIRQTDPLPLTVVGLTLEISVGG